MSYWIKLYIETLHDPKIGRLDDHLYRRFMDALLLAGEEGRDGLLPDPPDAAWVLRTSVESLLKDWNELAEHGLLAETDEGWLVVNFAKRQGPSEAAGRVKLHRERKQSLQKRYSNSYSNSYSNVSSNTPYTESESEQSRGEVTPLHPPRDFFDSVQAIIERHVGLPSAPRDVPALQELSEMDDFREQDVIDAIVWNKQQGRVVHGAAQLLGSIKYSRAKRIQADKRAGPTIDELYPDFKAGEND